MNRRDFVSKGLGAAVAGSQAAHKLLAIPPAKNDDTWLLTSDTIRASLTPEGTLRSFEVKHDGHVGTNRFLPWAIRRTRLARCQAPKRRRLPDEFRRPSRWYSLFAALQARGWPVGDRGRLEERTRFRLHAESCPAGVGINCEMLSYPTWNDRYFPTLLRCEKTHFWGYFMTPCGRILTIGSPDPVASYMMNYEKSSWGDGGHLINTCSLDLMHALALAVPPSAALVSLKAGEKRTWTIYIQPLDRSRRSSPLWQPLSRRP